MSAPLTCDFNETDLERFNDLQCNKGYEGVLCGTCSEGYGLYDLECYKCKHQALVAFWLLARMIWVFIVCAAAVISSLSDAGSMVGLDWAASHPRPDSPLVATSSEALREEECEVAHRNMTESVKILLNFAQLNGVAVTINTSWTNSIKRALHILSIVGAMTVEATVSLDCLFDNSETIPRSIRRTTISVLSPFVILALGFAYWMIVLRKDPVTLRRRLVLSAVVVFYVSFIGWVEELAGAMNCITIDDGIHLPRRLWAQDTSVECFTGTHKILMWTLVVPLIVALSGFTLGCASFLYHQKHKNGLAEISIQEMFGFMYAAYKPECVYWEFVVLIRKAVLGLVVVFGASLGSNVQSITAISILILSLFLQTRLVPYKDDFQGLNLGEVYSLLVVIFTFIAGLYYYDPSVGSITRILVSILTVTLITGFVLYIFWAIYNRSVIYCLLTLEIDGVAVPEGKNGLAIIMIWIRHNVKKSKSSLEHNSTPLIP